MKVRVLDGNYYLYRAYHADNNGAKLCTSDGRPSGVMKLMYNMLMPLLRDQGDIIAVFDAEGKNFRHEIFPDYKKKRPPAPDELIAQKKDVRELCRALGLPVVKKNGVEADDVLGTIARYCTEHEQVCTILTGDKDIMQFMSRFVSLHDPKSGVSRDVLTLRNDKNLSPKQFAYYLALCGDKVDNIPGVPGIGDVKALELLHQYGTLKEIAMNAHKIKGAMGKALVAHMDDLKLSFKLARGKTDVELQFDKLKRKPIDPKRAAAVLNKYEIMHHFLKPRLF